MLRLVLVLLTIATLSSCSVSHRHIDEKYAAKIAKEALSLPDCFMAQKLNGGSDASIFLVTDGTKKYVIKFLATGLHRESEIYNTNIASKKGCGPQVYSSDYVRGFVLMEYLSGKKVTTRDFQSEQFYGSLAHLLRKIHQGKTFKGCSYNIFERIDKEIQTNKARVGSDVPLTKMGHLVSVIRQALLPHLISTVPCHNDLHSGNLIFLENEFKAIDYGDAGQGDPFFDVAAIAQSIASLSTPEYEKKLLSIYLGREPSEVELAKLYLMKLIVSIRWFTTDLERIAPEIVHQFKSIKVPLLREIAKAELEGRIDRETPENKLNLLKAQLKDIFDHFESQGFRDALNILGEKFLKQGKQ